MQYVQSGSRNLLFGFKWAPHIIQIKTKDVFLGTFSVESKGVNCFCLKWCSYVFSKLNAK
jgi:hypothetical protein